MKFAAIALVAYLAPVALAFELVSRENPKVFGLNIQRRSDVDSIVLNRLRKRAHTVQETLDNELTLYYANVSIGTPAQAIRLDIGMGSSDLWVNTKSSELCSSGSNCSDSGTYDANSSSTYTYVNSLFQIEYADSSGASGDYVMDTLSFGGQTIEDMQFGVGYDSNSTEGLLGIGYGAIEADYGTVNAYANLPQRLADNKIINSNAYSLWLNDLDASTGTILFGGIDTEKYTGSLNKVPIIPEDDQYREFIIWLTGLGLNGNQGSLTNGTANNTCPALLDPGESITYLPDGIVQAIYTKYGASISNGYAYVDCSLADRGGSIDFTFSGPTISVSLKELVIVVGTSDDKDVCILGIAAYDGSTCILGDTFLRSAYVVYDLENNVIALAQTIFNSTKTNVLEITSGANAIPDVSGAATGGASATAGNSGSSTGIQPSVTRSKGAAPMATARPWLSASAAMAGAGILIGLNGF